MSPMSDVDSASSGSMALRPEYYSPKNRFAIQSGFPIEKLSNLPETAQGYRYQRSCTDAFEWSSRWGLIPVISRLTLIIQ
jgi:hypothetical protein